ncbi:MAG: hypothetical protein M1831_001507 [Alyxoria varia]|nr:MAG: hypothetical protein M1831_001507 [Alyxoria varia]
MDDGDRTEDILREVDAYLEQAEKDSRDSDPLASDPFASSIYEEEEEEGQESEHKQPSVATGERAASEASHASQASSLPRTKIFPTHFPTHEEVKKTLKPLTPPETTNKEGKPGKPEKTGPTRTTYDPARKLKAGEIWAQRLILFLLVLVLNGICGSALASEHRFVFAWILFVKSKDVLSCIWSMICLLIKGIIRLFKEPPPPAPSKWILTLVPTYEEAELQIIQSILALRDNDVKPHKQIMCVLLDGKPRDVRGHMTRILKSYKRPYMTYKNRPGELRIDIGFLEDVPIIAIEKARNAGKKDSLILCHDLFNYPRKNLPMYSMLLRAEMHEIFLPMLTKGEEFNGFDMILCTDADSTFEKGAVKKLADALHGDERAIAACGVLLAEFEKGRKWSVWTLYQLYQYCFGQYVRRQAEGFWGRVTCLPGCVCMVVVRPEMAGAIQSYAQPVENKKVILHQVQYLGTDRRLTYLMLQQSKKLRTLFVPDAVCETSVPQALRHYLSQRRRWGSNAYYNTMFFLIGKNQFLVTRAAALVDLARLTTVYFRLANTIYFLYFIATSFALWKIIPFLVVSLFPTAWFAFQAAFMWSCLRRRFHKLLLGFVVNKFMAAFLSIIVFTIVLYNLGSQVWGMTGITRFSKRSPEPKTKGDRTEAWTVEEHLGGNSGTDSGDYANDRNQEKQDRDDDLLPVGAIGFVDWEKKK